MRQFMTGVALLASAAAQAQTTTPAAPAAASPPPAATGSIQERFDWATAAMEDGRCTEAVEQFAMIEQRPAVRNAPLVRDAIAVRKGRCLLRMGRGDEGEVGIRAGLPTLSATGQSFASEVFAARRALATLSIARLDYAAAKRELEAGLAPVQGQDRVAALVDLARVTSFDGGPEPLARAQEAIDLIRARTEPNSALNKEQLGFAMAVHARILLNQGRTAEAYAELKAAVALLGGLSTSVTLTDVITRSDTALAAILEGKPEDARKYLAYTGAGRMENSPFARAVNMSPPDCGAADGLGKDDMAVVEFSLGEDGSVIGVAPIYTTRGREVALTFARAVQGWSWSPADAKAIPAFFRMATRVELRCSTASGERASLTDPLRQIFWKWAGVPLALETAPETDARRLPIARQISESANEKEQIAGLAWIGTSRLVPPDERMATLDKALAIASRMDAPAAAFAFLSIERAQSESLSKSRHNGTDLRSYRALLAQPAIAADPISAAALRLIIARGTSRDRAPDAEALVDAVIAEPRLPANDPLRVSALLEKASLAARRGDPTTAQASFEKTGLTAQQCAVIGAPPAMKRTGVSSADFPAEAARWGFDGWVQTEYDILADGHTAGQRATIAYPPFIFNNAATGIARDRLYQTTYRPEMGTGCTGIQSNTIFRIPR